MPKGVINRIIVPELVMMARRLLCLSGWRMRQRYKTIDLIFFFGSDSHLQYRQVRNELAIEKIVRQRSVDGRSSFSALATFTTLNVPK